MSVQLYRHFNGVGDLLYVGCSNNIIRRIEQHEASAHWLPEIATITVEHFASGTQALAAEKAAILAEHPIHNVRGKAPAFRRSAEELDQWNSIALDECRKCALRLLTIFPDKQHFLNNDLAKAKLRISGAMLQSGLIRKVKFGRRDCYLRADIQSLAAAPDNTWVISSPRIRREVA